MREEHEKPEACGGCGSREVLSTTGSAFARIAEGVGSEHLAAGGVMWGFVAKMVEAIVVSDGYNPLDERQLLTRSVLSKRDPETCGEVEKSPRHTEEN